ncbi:vWA domain-containing protein [Planctomicrobium piriforme]|uniref:von Willebrand factor type A domain-containing protein n=1 Tax=Planctomicrobium piriforme TaxID=1576369 RepID=A0A1I3DL44_9PLAN|nr:vWA domain-containing protein [Planctomicrobium piriforme]SFH87211.1 von Willebrand factor type A domain-containing protein [Planctomicrobium piriforme]
MSKTLKELPAWTKDLPAWGISLGMNLSILAALNFIVFESVRGTEGINTIVSDLQDLTQDERVNFAENITEDQVGNGGTGSALPPSVSAATAVGGNDESVQDKLEEILNPQMAQLSEASIPRVDGDVGATVSIKGNTDNAMGGVGGVEGAMDRVAFEIRQSLKERKTLVIWVMDASGSLDKRREAIAERFDNIYKQLNSQGTTEGLHSMIVSYGDKTEILTPEPIQDVAALSEIVRKKIKKDDSGHEYVFAALKQVLDKYRNWQRASGPWNRMIFIVTDERGDDAEQYLEDVITNAKRSQTKVYTIGNAAIFGRQKGYVHWVGENGYEEDIPVDQGPESAFPDGLQLPFVGSRPDWKLNQMSSSYGPYALTRLCAETGGLYLITEESRGYAFDRAVMRRYAPDYRPIRVQEQEIAKNAAKASLVTVAGITYQDSLPTPKVEFRAYNDNILRTDLTEAQKEPAEAVFALKRMYDALKAGETSRDSLKEDRWRASFDLAMGRILAMQVRYFGYNQMLAAMKVSPKSFANDKDNMWRMVSSDKIESGPDMRKAAEMARTYLKRVIDEHPGTPWALMAERELSTPLGWGWEEFSQPIPGTNQLKGSDEEVARLLLADDERKKEAAKKRNTQRQNVPKL